MMEAVSVRIEGWCRVGLIRGATGERQQSRAEQRWSCGCGGGGGQAVTVAVTVAVTGIGGAGCG